MVASGVSPNSEPQLFDVCDSCSVMSDSCNPMNCSPPGSSVHGILQARLLEWGAIPFYRGSSRPRDQTRVSCIGRRILYHLGSPLRFQRATQKGQNDHFFAHAPCSSVRWKVSGPSGSLEQRLKSESPWRFRK